MSNIGVNLDYNAIKRIITNYKKIPQEKCRIIFIQATKEFMRQVIKNTPYGRPDLWKNSYVPKGYQPGQLKNNWRVALSTSVPKTSPGWVTRDKGGRRSIAEISKIDQWKPGTPLSFYNPVIYAAEIEFNGHSRLQAPQGMLRIAMADFPALLKKYADQVKGKRL